jgi:hypothetical protein
MSAPFFSKPPSTPTPDSKTTLTPRLRRINPWRMFVGSMIPNWLQCRREVSQGAKLAYARLAQHAGRDGECFPKQQTLAAELGVSERTANEYVRTLVKYKLIEMERPGLGRSNRYFFLDHPWMHDGQPETPQSSNHEPQKSSAPDRKNSSAQERQKTSVPYIEENQEKGESMKNKHTQSQYADGLPHSLEEAVKVARQLGIEEEFAGQEFHAKKSVGWKDGYGNSITSWPDYLQARWAIEQRKRTERRATGRQAAKRPQPPRQFHSGDYKQSVKDF